MTVCHTHGASPFRVAVVHGGPGAAGEMAPVARELARTHGVLEPWQTAMTVAGQVAELQAVLKEHAAGPATLIGYSWGAWLVYLLAAQAPALVKKLILVSSGGFEEAYGAHTEAVRMGRLTQDVRTEIERLKTEKSATSFARLGELLAKADHLDPLPEETAPIELRPDIFQSVWPEAAALRASGELLAQGRNIRCSVVAIHGDYDPHPAEGVAQPLRSVLRDFRLVLLERCGHCPWQERQARDAFFAYLCQELKV